MSRGETYIGQSSFTDFEADLLIKKPEFVRAVTVPSGVRLALKGAARFAELYTPSIQGYAPVADQTERRRDRRQLNGSKLPSPQFPLVISAYMNRTVLLSDPTLWSVAMQMQAGTLKRSQP